MVKKLLSVTALFLFMASATAMAQVNIGYLDTHEVLSKLPERQKVQKKLSDFIEQEKAKLTVRTTEYQDSVADYQAKKASMSAAQLKKAQQHLTDMQRKMNAYSQQLKQDIAKKRSDLLEPVLTRVDDAISTVAKKQGLDFVFNKTVNTGDNIIFYADQSQKDITQLVITQLTSTNGN